MAGRHARSWPGSPTTACHSQSTESLRRSPPIPRNGTTRAVRCIANSWPSARDQPIESWTDVEGQPLETRLADIAVAIVVHGERVCRSSAQHHREWVIKRKADIAEEQRRKEEERRRLERERLERLEKAQIARLLAQAKALRDAQDIRAYVAAVRDVQAALDSPLTETELQHWSDWALSQADRVDPVLNGSFKTVQSDD